MASCFDAEAVPNTSAPTCLAIWVAAIPTPPAAARHAVPDRDAAHTGDKVPAGRFDHEHRVEHGR